MDKLYVAKDYKACLRLVEDYHAYAGISVTVLDHIKTGSHKGELYEEVLICGISPKDLNERLIKRMRALERPPYKHNK